MEEMTKEEMQRFLNREAEKGTTEHEALKALDKNMDGHRIYLDICE
nr:MAG TPA: hypothetical protein [Bacteriophage sp.]